MKRQNNPGAIIALVAAIREQANTLILSSLSDRGITDILPAHGAVLNALFKQSPMQMNELAEHIGRQLAIGCAVMVQHQHARAYGVGKVPAGAGDGTGGFCHLALGPDGHADTCSSVAHAPACGLGGAEGFENIGQLLQAVRNRSSSAAAICTATRAAAPASPSSGTVSRSHGAAFTMSARVSKRASSA